jgi:hypothetical protein
MPDQYSLPPPEIVAAIQTVFRKLAEPQIEILFAQYLDRLR